MKIDKGKRPMAEWEEETRWKKKMKWWEEEEEKAVAEIVSESDEEESESEDDDVSDIDFELDEVNKISENKISESSNSNYDWDEFLLDRFPPVEESDEELISDRDEEDDEYNFIIKKGLTVTNPRKPRKIYKRNNSILDDLSHPLQTLAKLALDQYNSIEGKNYVYKGLVKAYHFVVDGFIYQIRFKAYLKDQDPINFQATVYEGIPKKPKPGQEMRDVEIHIQGVYPLP